MCNSNAIKTSNELNAIPDAEPLGQLSQRATLGSLPSNKQPRRVATLQ
jgi:hypothetical protein